MGKLFHYVKSFYQDISKTASDYSSFNLRRLYYASALAIPLNILAIAMHFFSVTEHETWKNIIIIINCTMLLILAVIFFFARTLRKRICPGKIDYILQYCSVSIFIIYSIVITAADQPITHSISPYIMASLIVGAIFLFRPAYAFVFNICSYALFFFAVGFTDGNEASILLSNRMNGFIVTVISILISLIMWRYNNIYFMQTQRIHNQQLELEAANRELEAANKELEKMAYSDPLTGLPNRRHFDDIVNKEMRLIGRKGHESCLIMLDIDFFKMINDRYGHPVGDELLVQVGKLLKCHIRKSDSLCRLGGEEFIILLPHTDLNGAVTVAESLREIIEHTQFEASADNVKMTASFGVAQLSCSGDKSFIHNYAKADNALYQAKLNGRNCVKAA